MNLFIPEKLKNLSERYYQLNNDTRTLDDYPGLEESAIDLCAAIILDYFRESDISLESNMRYEKKDLMKKLGIISIYEKMVDLFLHVLANKMIITINQNEIIFKSETANRLNTEICLKKIHDLYAHFSPFFTFLVECGRQYHEVLMGIKTSQAVLFPTGDTHRLENIYKNIPKIGHEQTCLKLARDVVFLLCSENKISCSLLEVGSGQGILTQLLSPLIGQQISTYYFSDISHSLVEYGKLKFNAFSPHMKFLTLNVEKSPVAQGLTQRFADIIAAFNVIHATGDIKKTLLNLRQYIRPSGYFLLIENVKQEVWIDMIYGLTEGWWNYHDGYRTYSPLLTHEQWQEVIIDAGFTDFTILPDNDELKSDTALILIKNLE